MQPRKDGTFDKCNAICKIHSELSVKNGSETLSDVRILQYILACLLAEGPDARAVKAFADGHRIRIHGSNERFFSKRVSISSCLR